MNEVWDTWNRMVLQAEREKEDGRDMPCHHAVIAADAKIKKLEKCCELKKQNDALIESFETLAEVLETGDKNMKNLAGICREQLRRILE